MALLRDKSRAGAGSTDKTAQALYIRKPFIILSGSTEGHVLVDPDTQYWLQHNVLDGAAAATTVPVYVGIAESITASDAAGDNKFALLPDHPVFVGPGLSAFYVKSASNVSVSVLPTERARGQH